jgi:hypothetical protein
MGQPATLSIALIGANAALVRSCKAALQNVANVTAVAGDTSNLEGFDVALLVLQSPYTEGVRFFGSCREQFPKLPVILLTSELDVRHSEFLKLGAADCLDFGEGREVPWHKVERAILGVARPVFASPLLDVLVQPTNRVPVNAGQKRSCFRAAVPPHVKIVVLFLLPTGTQPVAVADLSIRTDEADGGMGLRADSAAAARLPIVSWPPGTQVPIAIDLSGRHIKAQAIVRRIQKDALGLLIGIHYTLKEPRDEPALQAVWLDCQRAAGHGR